MTADKASKQAEPMQVLGAHSLAPEVVAEKVTLCDSVSVYVQTNLETPAAPV